MTVVVAVQPAQAAVVRPMTLNYDQELYGDFILAGNGNSTCPGLTSPTDPFGEPKATCATAQDRTYTAAAGLNDSYYMNWADVDSDAASYNSSRSTVTIPSGARVAFARLSWSGDTGTIRLADGTVSALPGCNTRQFLAGAGTAVLPAGTPESTSVRLTVGSGATAATAPQVISRDALANVPASQPQFYAAFADVTSRFADTPTGTPVVVNVGNVWTPQGFGCYSGWSLTLVYEYDGPTPAVPAKKEVFVYDGHVRQSSIDPATTVTMTGFRASAAGARVGVTGFEGDLNIAGDQFLINGTAVAEPDTTATTNFFNSSTDFSSSPAVANNMSVDAKSVSAAIPAGATSATTTFATSGDTFLGTGIVLSVPVTSLDLTTSAVPAGPYLPGDTITYTITAVSPGAPATDVAVQSTVDDCDRTLGALAADVPVVYPCTGPAPDDDATVTNTLTGLNDFGDSMSDVTTTPLEINHPAVEITMTTDQPSYTAGQTVTFTVVVENTGDTPLTDVTISDPTVPSCDASRPALAAGDQFAYTCTATAPLTGDSTTSTVTAAHAGGSVSDTATVPVLTLGSVTGLVFADRDNDGVVDPGETGISGVTVTMTGTASGGSPVNLATTTGGDGSYAFTGVTGGSYTLTETQPAAYDDGIDTPGSHAVAAGNDAVTTTLTSGQSSTGNLFAERSTSSLSGEVYVDQDADGARDVGEPGVTSAELTLSGQDDDGNAVSLTTASAAGTGAYSFSGLRPGTYQVVETQPAGYGTGTDAIGTADGTLEAPNTITEISLPARTAATGYLFGETTGGLSGSVYADLDGDGSNGPGDTGIAGVTVTLTGSDTNGVIDPVVATTAADGSYTFAGLLAGTYTIVETQPAAYGDGPATAGSAEGTVGTNSISSIALGAGEAATGYLFGETTGVLSGAVYADLDGDGANGSGDTGIGGVTVTLTGTDSSGAIDPIVTTTTADGSYSFPGLLDGTYTITETQPEAYGDGVETVGSTDGTVGDDVFSDITLAGGSSGTGYLFGETTSSIAVAVFHDADGNGTQDEDETGLDGVSVTLTGTDVDGGEVDLTAPTTADGTYVFAGLLAGTYTLTEDQPAGYGDGAETLGTADGTLTGPDSITEIEMAGGVDATGYLFGETTGLLSGAVYADLDGNGSNGSGDAGIGGVTVTLTGTDTSGAIEPIETTTAADGSYAFTGLLAGTYTITETQPEAYGDGAETAGTADGTAGNDIFSGIALAGGSSGTGYLFGETAAALSGAVYADLDGDHAHGAGDTGIGGVTVTLTGTDASGAMDPIETTTAADGSYAFTGLVAGTYTITETQPTAYGDGLATAGTADGTVGANALSEITLAGGVSATGYLFGETTGSISVAVFHDRNANGGPEQAEPGIEGVSVTLTGTDLNGGDVDVTASTAADGSYVFAGLLAGTYTLTETQPSGFADGPETAGTAGGTSTGPDSITEIELAGGVDATGYVFSETRGSLGGRVWLDADNDGIEDDDEAGAEGVTVTLYQVAAESEIAALAEGPGDVVTTAVTDADGTYLFADLPAGTYRIGIDPGEGRALTVPGTNDDPTGSDFDWLTGLSPELVVDLEGGETTNQTSIDAGIRDRADDLGVTLTAEESSVPVGGSIRLTAEVTNHGSSPATGATLTVALPPSALVGAVGEGWTCTTDDTTVTCTTSDVVLPGASLPAVSVEGTAIEAGTDPADATVSFADDTVDVAEENNTASAPLTIEAVTIPTDDPTDDPTDTPSDNPTSDSPSDNPNTDGPTNDTPSDNPTDDGPLPTTGAATGSLASLGLGAVLAGLILLVAVALVRRRMRQDQV